MPRPTTNFIWLWSNLYLLLLLWNGKVLSVGVPNCTNTTLNFSIRFHSSDFSLFLHMYLHRFGWVWVEKRHYVSFSCMCIYNNNKSYVFAVIFSGKGFQCLYACTQHPRIFPLSLFSFLSSRLNFGSVEIFYAFFSCFAFVTWRTFEEFLINEGWKSTNVFFFDRNLKLYRWEIFLRLNFYFILFCIETQSSSLIKNYFRQLNNFIAVKNKNWRISIKNYFSTAFAKQVFW